jgi:hypothetical protein
MLQAGIQEAQIMRIGGWKTTDVFHRYTIIDRRMMAAAARQYERYRAEQAVARAENGHTLGILDSTEAKNTPAKKLQ